MKSLVPFVVFWMMIAATLAQQFIEPADFLAGMQKGEYDAVIDVRTVEEWNEGHIENTTLVENLASTGTPDTILGCSNCTIAIYCRSGNRAGQAIIRLRNEYGFTGILYNARGVNQWTSAGYSLIQDDSVTPPCALSECESCAAGCPTKSPEMNTGSGSYHIPIAFAMAMCALGITII